MPVNIELLDKAMEAVEEAAQRGEWDQSDYQCGTGGCVAYWACVAAGGTYNSDTGKVEFPDGDANFIAPGAAELLGIDFMNAHLEGGLFHSRNTLDDLRRIVAELKAEATG